MSDSDSARIVATHALDQLDAAMAELEHHLATGERVCCPRCDQSVPSAADGTPVRHQLRAQWCGSEVDRQEAAHR